MFGIDDAALVMGGASFLGNLFSNQQNRSSAAQAQDFSAQQYATRYQTQVADMKAAGLNPMLAYQQSPGSSPTGVTYQARNPMEGVSSAFNETRKTPSEVQRNTSSAAQADANARQQDKVVERIAQEIVNLKTDNDRGRAVIDNLAKEGDNLVKQGWNLTEVGNQLRATIGKMSAEINHMGYQNVLLEAQKYLTGKQTELAGFDVKAANDMGNVGREMGQLKPIFDILSSILRSTRR